MSKKVVVVLICVIATLVAVTLMIAGLNYVSNAIVEILKQRG